MSDLTQQDPVVARVKTEIFYAVLFTVITLILAAGMLYMLPRFQAYMRDVNPELIHKRSFEMYPDGGAIIYAPAADGAVAGPEALKRYQIDLEILSRRFERGNFEMASLSGLRNSPVLKEVLGHQKDYSFRVEKSPSMVVLRIKSDGRKATKALHDYLTFLEKNWVFQP